MAVTIAPVIRPAATGVSAPSAISRPPKHSAIPASQALNLPGPRPIRS